MLAPRAPSATRSRSSTDQIGCPTWTGHLAPALVGSRERGGTGILHVAGGGAARGTTSPTATFEAAGVDCRVAAGHDRRARRAPRPGPRSASSARARRRARAAAVARRTRRLPGGAREVHRHEAAGLRRRRLHRLELRPPAPARARRRGRRARQAHLRRARGEPRRPRRRAGFASSAARSRTRTPSPTRSTARDAIVNFAAETHVDRSIAEPDAFVTTHALGHLRAARGGARARPALRPGLHRRGLRLDRGGHVHRELAAARPPRRTRATKAGADLLVASLLPHLRPARR